MINLKYWECYLINYDTNNCFILSSNHVSGPETGLRFFFSGHETVKCEFCLQYRHDFVFRPDIRIKGSFCSHNLEKQSDKLFSWEHFLERVFLKNLRNLLLFSRPSSLKLPGHDCRLHLLVHVSGLRKHEVLARGKSMAYHLDVLHSSKALCKFLAQICSIHLY